MDVYCQWLITLPLLPRLLFEGNHKITVLERWFEFIPRFFFDGPVRSFEMAVFLLERYWLLTFTGMAAIQMTFSHGYEVRMPLLDMLPTRFL